MKINSLAKYMLLLPLIAICVTALAVDRKKAITNFLPEDDPVRQMVDSHFKGMGWVKVNSLVNAINGGHWHDPAFFHADAYDHLLAAWHQSLISFEDFIDAQDYLHLLSDFSSLRPDDGLPVKIESSLVERLPVDIPLLESLKLSSEDDSYDSYEKYHQAYPEKALWVTAVTLNQEDMDRYHAIERIQKQCGKMDINYQRCLSQVLKRNKKSQLLGWVLTKMIADMDMNVIVQGNRLLFMPVVLHLFRSASENPDIRTDLTPVYGQLGWDELLQLRLDHGNPGNIYQPKSGVKYLTPHDYYSGASMFLRHDLFHQNSISDIPDNHKQFYAWLHGEEQAFLKQVEENLLPLESKKRPLKLQFNRLLPFSDSQLMNEISGMYDQGGALCLSVSKEMEFSPKVICSNHSGGSLYQVWEPDRKLGNLLTGVFADMDFLELEDYDAKAEDRLAKHIEMSIFYLATRTGWNFEDTLKSYVIWLFDAMARDKAFIASSFGISVEGIKEHLMLPESKEYPLDAGLRTLLGRLLDQALAIPR